MHPNAFLRSFWRAEFRPVVFVAMSFEDRYQDRYERVLAPAIRSAGTTFGISLEPGRVDVSKTGDSILTEIVDGIAHCQLVLADVSCTGKDSVSGRPYRNANVMYEVGLALACRQPSEVLLIRDDHDAFLFDVSTVPHLTMDFTDPKKAVPLLAEAINGRLIEQKSTNDARTRMAFSSLSNEEVEQLRYVSTLGENQIFGRKDLSIVDFSAMTAIPRLLDKQLIRVAGVLNNGSTAYAPTPIGRVVARMVATRLPGAKPAGGD